VNRSPSSLRAPWAKPLRDTLIIVGITAALFVVAEAGLRFWFPEKVTVLDEDDPWLAPHPDFIYTLRPGVAYDFIHDTENGGDTTRWESNSQAFRGPERHPADLRVAVYGDSNVMARFSPWDETFTARLEAALGDELGSKQTAGGSARRVEVINAGVDGYGPDQSYLKMQAEMASLHPDVVVLDVFADNDFGDLVRNRLFDVRDGTLVRHDNPVTFQPSTRFGRFRAYLSTLLTIRAVHEVLQRLGLEPDDRPPSTTGHAYIDQLLDFSEKEYRGFRDGGPAMIVDHYDADLALGLDTEATRAKVTLMRSLFREVRRLERDTHVHVLVLIEPSVIDLTTNWTELSFEELAEFPAYRRDRLTSLVRALCDEAGLESLDLFDLFSDNSPNSLYFKAHDNHWNAKGQDLAARATARYIVDHYLNHASERDPLSRMKSDPAH